MDEKILRDRKYDFRALLLCGLITLFLIWILAENFFQQQTPADLVGSLLGLGFFGFVTYISYQNLRDKSVQLHLNDRGLTDNRTKIGLIEWRDIQEARFWRMRTKEWVTLSLSDPLKYHSRTGASGTPDLDKNGLYNYNLLLSGLEISKVNILDLIKSKIAAPLN